MMSGVSQHLVITKRMDQWVGWINDCFDVSLLQNVCGFFFLKGKQQQAEVRPDVFLLGRSETTHCQHVHELGLRKYMVEHLPQINHIKEEKTNYIPFLSIYRFFKKIIYWLAVITLPSLCPKSVSLILSSPPKQGNCFQTHGLVYVPVWC